MLHQHERAWWKDGVVYQIYPASFKDSNHDGLGDLPGILSKIDYLKELGVDIIWICPMYKSPQHDMGYDISDYQDVHAPYGTVKDVDNIIEACHSRGMRIILDLAINHTSDEHEWFKESRSSKNNKKRDWYIWRPAKYTEDGQRMPPNNWASFFHGSAWEWDETTQEYYLHLFAKQQPDLNWENEETRKAIYDNTMVFWLKRGIDGFRVDCANMYSKDTTYRDAPIINKGFVQPAASLFCNGPRLSEYLREVGSELKKYNAMTVGELPFTPDFQKVLQYVKAENEQLNMVFQFDFIDLGHGQKIKFEYEPFKLSKMKNIISSLQTFIDGTDGWTTTFCENHDHGRSISRFASDAPEWRERSGKLMAMLTCSLSGTLFIYQGQEIGMINAPKDWPIEEYKDIESINHHKNMIENGISTSEKVMENLQILARDHGRFPMQWDDSPFAGFSTKKPWMQCHPEYKDINVASQSKRNSSVLNFWKNMLKIRKEYNDYFVYGSFQGHDMDNQETFVFEKSGKIAVALNFTDKEQVFKLPADKNWKLLIGTVEGVDKYDNRLSGYEGRLYLAA
ncbi:Alpha-glucosidase [Golovinomyces cichoracearum]|uniref:Alpha-glucosidase n=1 Tax=Golovinomyces cichoracearum TaxID=62708 RepID=A0A420IFF9_9PEZI|nr:Alpha-glucosidase [Golovinomyces cichoracearum]